jgi:hypothetical protein
VDAAGDEAVLTFAGLPRGERFVRLISPRSAAAER